MHPLIKKLNFKDQKVIAILGAPESFVPIVEVWQDLATVDTHLKQDMAYPFLLCFVRSKADVVQFSEQLTGHLAEDALLWFAYPKKSSKQYQTDISRDDGWQAVGALGFEGVRQVAIDEDWSALRFRATEYIKELTRKNSMALSHLGKKRTK